MQTPGFETPDLSKAFAYYRKASGKAALEYEASLQHSFRVLKNTENYLH